MSTGEADLEMSPCQIIRLKPKDYARCANIWDMVRQPDMTQKWYDELLSGKRLIFGYTIADEFVPRGRSCSTPATPTIPSRDGASIFRA